MNNKTNEDTGTQGLNFSLEKIGLLRKVLTKKERFIIKVLIFTIVVALLTISANWYINSSKVVPKIGGEYIEGVIGTPRLVNPILSQTNEVDRDITYLLFNGLLKQQENKLVPDIAENLPSISEDKLTYTFAIRKDIFWHDGAPLTSSDIVFTIKSIQNPEFNSPLHRTLSGVRVSAKDAYTVTFTLSKPFAPFLSLLTFGILPEHIWENVTPGNAHLAEYNLKNPIGTGPYKVQSFSKDNLGNVKRYTVIRNESFYGPPPYIETITFKFYPDYLSAVEALNNKNIDGINYLPKKYHSQITNKNIRGVSLSLPQYSAIFFNTSRNEVLKSLEVRKALTHSIKREDIVREVLDSQGEVIYAPILPGFIGYHQGITKPDYNHKTAKQLLTSAGWTRIGKEEFASTTASKDSTATPVSSAAGEVPTNSAQNFFWKKGEQILTITLTTINNPETAEAANLIKKFWEDIGVKVNISIVSEETLKNDVLRERNYEILLFGQIIGNDPDPYAFWHSSQIGYPGVNLAIYKNEKVDRILEDARKITDPWERAKLYIEFQKILNDDIPAIFLYNPTYPYIIHDKIKGFSINKITIPADRLGGIMRAHIKTKRVLKEESDD